MARRRTIALALCVLLGGLLALAPSCALAGTRTATVELTAPSVSQASLASSTATASTIGGRATRGVTLATVSNSSTPVLVTVKNRPPTGYRLAADQVLAIARRSPTVIAELHRQHRRLVAYEYTKGPGQWQVSWFTPPGGRAHQYEEIQVYVSDTTGRVTQAWTGFQVAWSMARGYTGAFGRVVNAWFVWIPLCLLFLAPFLPSRRRRPGLMHLDLLMLLGFSISLAFFNHADLGMSVPLNYPFLIYFLVRMVLLAFGKGRPRSPLRPNIPIPLLAIGIVFLVGFRLGLNVTDSNVIDVGYAGVIGADKLVHNTPLYGGWPSDNPQGDTYGPVNYYAYVPARLVFGWSGVWDDLPAAHAAAIAFDLLTMLGLFLLGRRIRGPSTGVMLAYLWAAYPFSLFVLSSNSNDALVSALVVLMLLVLTSAPARGVVGALAGLTKFAPLGLAPLFLRGVGDSWPSRRSTVLYVLAYVVTTAAMFIPVILKHDLTAFWDDSIKYQAGRSAPFSIWGLWGGLDAVQRLVQGMAVGLALVVAFVPQRRTIVEVAALGAAVMIAVQLSLTYWFYLYIVWFFPLVIVALGCARPRREAALEHIANSISSEPAPAPAGSPALAFLRQSGPAPR